MKKSDIIDLVFDEIGPLYSLNKGALMQILKEYETALINGLERDGEVPLLNFGKLVLEIKKPRTVKSKFVKNGEKQLPERMVIDFLPGKLVKSLVAEGDFERMRTRVKIRKRPSL